MCPFYSIDLQTVVCFPLMGGVLELGVTELVLSFAKFTPHGGWFEYIY